MVRKAIAMMANQYGPQGWWPVECERASFLSPSREREIEGYHPGQYDFPRTAQGRFEIGCGAILTQNTAWTNVQKALAGLRAAQLLSAEGLLLAPEDTLPQIIRPAGYFNQKSTYLRAFAHWHLATDQTLAELPKTRPNLEITRQQLLSVRGVGPETADSILLYAYALPTFVVDAYTRRVLGRLGLIDKSWNYEQIRGFLGEALRRSTLGATVEQYQEAHALIVEHAKRYHGRNVEPREDFLLRLI
jgi:endonuclease-3 related protein